MLEMMHVTSVISRTGNHGLHLCSTWGSDAFPRSSLSMPFGKTGTRPSRRWWIAGRRRRRRPSQRIHRWAEWRTTGCSSAQFHPVLLGFCMFKLFPPRRQRGVAQDNGPSDVVGPLSVGDHLDHGQEAWEIGTHRKQTGMPT